MGSIQKTRSVKTKFFQGPIAGLLFLLFCLHHPPSPFFVLWFVLPVLCRPLLCSWEHSGVQWTKWMLRSNLKWVH